MAEIVVGFLITKLATFVLDDLHEIFRQEANFLGQVQGDVESLQITLEWMQSFLTDVDGKQPGNKRAASWVTEIRDVAYDAEDVIDTFIFNAEQRRQRKSAAFIQRLVGNIKDTPTIHNIGNDIRDINQKLNAIRENRANFGIQDISLGGEASTSSSQGQQKQEEVKRPPIVEEVDVVGIDDEVDALVSRLIDERVPRRAVISITGMGGIGKTTLANKVYKNVGIKRHFNQLAWVFVSREYQVRQLLLSILSFCRTVTEDEKEKATVEELRGRLSAFLEAKRYLIIVDDIWDREAWDGLVGAFPERLNGSRVLLTTRKVEQVALYADPQSKPHVMRLLSEKESWDIFCKKAFPGDPSHECPSNLEKFAKQMVQKCGDLPLAVAALGGVLSRKGKSTHEWGSVLKRIEWLLMECPEDKISHILSLSYYDLPYYLKSCFLYFSAYPEDAEISIDDLITLWIAEGFVQRRGNNEELEDVAEDYVQELISRSMIQVAERRTNGAVRTCRVHDMFHELAISIAKKNNFLNVNDNAEAARVRRLVIHLGDGIQKYISPSTVNLRSFLYLDERGEPALTIMHFKLLRVLDIGSSRNEHLPEEISSLIHLRYLCLGRNINSLPRTITRLRNMQTLKGHSRGMVLPKDIWKMQQLRHIRMGLVSNCEDMQFHRLTNLQTLSVVGAGSWVEYQLNKLTKLREFSVTKVRSSHGKELSNAIAKLVCLKSLKLQGENIPPLVLAGHANLYCLSLEGKLSKLPGQNEFPPNLTELYLLNSYLEEEPMSTLERLPNLHKLVIEDFLGRKMVCSAGGFPLLQTLEITDPLYLVEWKVEEQAMPNLRYLEITQCKQLRELPYLQHITTLQELKAKQLSREIQSSIRKKEGKERDKIKHIASIHIS